MKKYIYYKTTEEKILSGENRELVSKLRSGMFPTISSHITPLICSWEQSPDSIANIMCVKGSAGSIMLIDEDNPQLDLYRAVSNSHYKLNIVKNGKTDVDIDSVLGYVKPINSCIVLSPSGKLTNHKDFRKAEGLVLLYKHSTDNIEDLASEGLLTRVLLANVEPVTFVWHCENLPKDITEHGVKFLNEFFKKHYPESEVKIILKDVDYDHMYGYLVQNIL